MDVSVSGVGVLDKAVAVLASLEGGPRSLPELVAATGLPRPTAHRLAVALEAHGLVRRDDAGRFALGLRLATLGRAAAEGVPLTAAARPALEALRDETGESVQLYVRAGDRRGGGGAPPWHASRSSPVPTRASARPPPWRWPGPGATSASPTGATRRGPGARPPRSRSWAA